MTSRTDPVPWASLRAAAAGVRDDAGLLEGSATEGWRHSLPADDPRSTWFDLYLPICNGGRDAPYVVGHLGQSVDGFIATCTGDSNFVTGDANIHHLHRLRALCDAVVVGAGTVASDDPRLTTRLVEGPSPLRVVLDSRRRLPSSHRIFCDGEARSLRVSCAPVDATIEPAGDTLRHEELLLPARQDGRLDLRRVLSALASRGIRRLFIEGGGETVSSFLEAGLLDRLHLAVAPLLIGSGRPAIRLDERPRLGDCLRPPTRIYRMGSDVLYDFDLQPDASRVPCPETELSPIY
ncbi:MAG: RibD family protein [Steroidobacteraceae bacterium]